MKHRAQSTRSKFTPAQKEAIYALPLSEQFRIMHIDGERGHVVYQHQFVDDQAPDYWQILAVAKAYARETDCWINPIVNKSALEGRKRLYPGIEDNANPDLTTDKYGFLDVKSPFSKSNIVSNANDASKQGAIAVITDLVLDEELKHKQIIQITKKIFSDSNRNHLGKPNYTKDQIHWFVDGKLLKYNRSEKDDSFPT